MSKPFTELQLKTVYRTGEDDLFNDFYQPVLSQAIRYDRAVGFFSSSIIASNIKGVSELIKKNGTMRLIIGSPLDEDEFEAIKYASDEKKNILVNGYMDELLMMIQEGNIASDRLRLLAILVATKKLEIKFAIRRKGMYHEKIGIAYDKFDNLIVFQGSANETPSALFENLNAESISVYQSWREQTFEDYGQHYVNAFEVLWKGEQKETLTIDVLSNHYENIIKHIKEHQDLNDFIEFDKLVSTLDESIEKKISNNKKPYPKIPVFLGDKKFEVREHQSRALTKWRANGFSGILKHATGSGKTITALYAISKVFEAKHKKNDSLVVIISVPYIALASQWVKELNGFNIYPVECFESKVKWSASLSRKIQLLQFGELKFLCILVVNKTLTSDYFQELIQKINKESLMVIGDECHRHGAINTRNALPDASFKLGLSATPFQDDDTEVENPFPNEAKDNILSYYGAIIDEYSLEDAINDGILTPYDYHIIPIHLTEEEQIDYDEVSELISSIFINSGGRPSKEERERLLIYAARRGRILGSAQNKLIALDELIKNTPSKDRLLSLFYVGEGTNSQDNKNIDEVSSILIKNQWRASQFIGETDKKLRKTLLDAFKNKEIDALVAMKVLDEGIDVPACQRAYILASTKNPRQYIQRRGRVLRRFPNKSSASIYDFVVLPCKNYATKYKKNLLKSELERIRDFTLLATNKVEIETIIDTLEMENA